MSTYKVTANFSSTPSVAQVNKARNKVAHWTTPEGTDWEKAKSSVKVATKGNRVHLVYKMAKARNNGAIAQKIDNSLKGVSGYKSMTIA